jgi:RNA polymerase sigma-70 factor, ECF subfamily
VSCPAESLASDADFDAALRAIRPRLWTFALRLTGNRRDAIDLVRRACVHAFERPEEFPTGFATPSAMFSLVHRIWFHQVRPARESRSGSS